MVTVLITGGARSGKSTFAEQYAQRSGTRGIYIATAQPYDEEMRERLRLHRTRREQSGFPWRTVEEPYELAPLLRRLDAEHAASPDSSSVVLVDCLTLWLSNRLLRCEEKDADRGAPEAEMEEAIRELVEAAVAYRGPLLLVTNEVGSGIVPEYPLGRRFRDYAGWLNRELAAACDRAFLVVAGYPLDLKQLAFRLESP